MLRPYQKTSINKTLSCLPDNPILVAPTGSGKTVMGTAIAMYCKRVLWLAHRTELIDQAVGSFIQFQHARPGVIMAGRPFTPERSIQVASVQSLANRDVPDVDLVIVDECHHAPGKLYQQVISLCGCPVLGLTATPFRLDGRGLGDFFGTIVDSISVRELIEQGYLCEPKVFSRSRPSLQGVKKTAGDYNVKQLAVAVNRPQLVGSIIDTWQDKALDMKTVCFAVDIEHSRNIVEKFLSQGVRAEHLDGKTPKNIRKDMLERLRSGDTQIISNCMVLTEGWDLPELECAIIARPTASLCLHRQMIGRIMRAAIGKDGAIVLDHAGNHHTHGSVTREIEYGLSGIVKRPGEPLGLKLCPDCYLLVESKMDNCPGCDYAFIPEKHLLRQASGELVEFDETGDEYKSDWWDWIDAQRVASGEPPMWAKRKYFERFGTDVKVYYPYGGIYAGIVPDADGDIEHKKKIWWGIERLRKAKNYKHGWASHQYKNIFGVWPRKVMSDQDKTERKLERINEMYMSK